MPQGEIPKLSFPGMEDLGRKFTAPHTRVEMTFWPQDTSKIPFVPKRGKGSVPLVLDKEKALASLIQFRWSKQMGQPSGTWTAVLKKRAAGPLEFGKTWRLDLQDQAIVDGDWVDIQFVRNGFNIPLCRGVVDEVREGTVSVGGATVEVYTIMGRDHGALFQYPITWNNLHARTLKELIGGFFIERVKSKVGGSPDELFEAIIQGYFTKGESSGQWKLPASLAEFVGGGDQTFVEQLKVVKIPAQGESKLRGGFFNELQLWNLGEQDLHQTLAQWINPMLNEWWYDLLPPKGVFPKGRFAGDMTAEDQKFGKMGAIIRERPFPSTVEGELSNWYDLPTWELPTWLIQTTDLGRGGSQRYNVFEILADLGFIGGQNEQAAIAKPSVNKDDIEKRGLRVYQQTTKYIDKGDWEGEREVWQKLIRDWNAPNPYLRQGTIVSKIALPEVRIGHRLKTTPGDPKRNEQFYVEAVNLEYAGPRDGGVPSTAQSTILVTRGFTGSDAELQSATDAVVGEFKED